MRRRLPDRAGVTDRGQTRLVHRHHDSGRRHAASELSPDTFLVAGGDIYPPLIRAAGLLEHGKRRPHWKVAHELAARRRTSHVEPDSILTFCDGTTYTSAGVSAGIDLALALVEEDHGPDLTRESPAAWWSTCSARAANRSSPPHSKAHRPAHQPSAESWIW